MAERYNQIYRQEQMRYSAGSPVIILSGALLSDTFTRKTLVQLKLKSISDAVISSLTVCVLPTFESADIQPEEVSYQYTGLNVQRDEYFGSNTAFVIKQSSAVSYKVRVKEVEFADGKRWNGGDKYFEALLPPTKLDDAFNGDVSEQFRIEYHKQDGPCIYKPERTADLWYCTCGEINRESEAMCHRCRRVQTALLRIDEEALRIKAEHRISNENVRAEEERAETTQNKSKRKILIAVSVIAALVLLLVASTVPGYLKQKKDYEKAIALLEDGKLDAAQEALTALGDYNDCAELVQNEIPYRRAMYIFSCAESGNTDGLVMLGMKRSELPEDESVSSALYKKAIEQFTALGNYKDSKDRIVLAQEALEDYADSLIQGRYDEAVALLSSRQYCEAKEAFEALGDYKNAAVMAQDCMYLKADNLLSLTDSYSMEGISCTIGTSTAEKSIFYVPLEIMQSKGPDFLQLLRDCCGDPSTIEYCEAPESSGCIPYCDAVAKLFASFGDYKDSEAKAAQAIQAGDYSAPFYELCEKGDLNGALEWLEGFKGTLENQDALVSIINTYLPFCGTWALSEGDPYLLSGVIGLSQTCLDISTTVKLSMDTGIIMHLVINGDESAALDLVQETRSNGGVRFAITPDDSHVYYFVLNDAGKLCCTEYKTFYSADSSIRSCVYKKQAC